MTTTTGSIQTFNTRNGKAEIQTVKLNHDGITKSFLMDGVLVCYYTGTPEAGFTLHFNNPDIIPCWYSLQSDVDNRLKTTFASYTGMMWEAAVEHAALQVKLNERMNDLNNQKLQKEGHSVIMTRQIADGVSAEITLDAEDRPTGARLIINGWVYGKVEVDGDDITVLEWHAMTHSYMRTIRGHAKTIAGFRRHLNNLYASFLQRPSNYLTTPDRA